VLVSSSEVTDYLRRSGK